ncbi:hypothetical protein C6P50_12910 [Enterococcus mundtii]|nr:hypothetical protein C6P50_12910 [Enterococcus mundtii]RYT04269.1 hypothetical protein EAI87_06975 [Enterococcus mundtii]
MVRISLCFFSMMCFSIGIVFLLRVKKVVRLNLGKSLSRSDYTKTEAYLTKCKFHIYIGFFILALNLILLRFN